MRKLFLLFVITFSSFCGFLFTFQGTAYADVTCLFNWSQAGCNQAKIPYCRDGDKCSLSGGLNAAAEAAKGSGINTTESASTFVTNLVLNLLRFITLIAVVYVLWAGFQIMIGSGDDEKMKKGRKTIVYVLIGIVIMWLAYAIVSVVISALTGGNTQNQRADNSPPSFISQLQDI